MDRKSVKAFLCKYNDSSLSYKPIKVVNFIDDQRFEGGKDLTGYLDDYCLINFDSLTDLERAKMHLQLMINDDHGRYDPCEKDIFKTILEALK